MKEKETQLEEYRKVLDHQGDEEFWVEESNLRRRSVLQDSEKELEEIKVEQDFETMYQRSYFHMLDRMKKDLIAFQIKSSELRESMKSKEGVMVEELEKSRKSKEMRMQSKFKLENYMKIID